MGFFVGVIVYLAMNCVCAVKSITTTNRSLVKKEEEIFRSIYIHQLKFKICIDLFNVLTCSCFSWSESQIQVAAH
ncbi:hypothetical protein RchiOBHm_Chr5g0076881 [Rosa chinensis]|uniref:Secreted protein n=1 Tax=Rosa chinensis TaxID=74649 RepID=A0A2P6QLU4_ROSCH|nr:hypothetical protein RchiOBHm_Chr5g0076881 [Rosa chinensis]